MRKYLQGRMDSTQWLGMGKRVEIKDDHFISLGLSFLGKRSYSWN